MLKVVEPGETASALRIIALKAPLKHIITRKFTCKTQVRRMLLL